jgi:hypothetical protein
MFEKKHQPLAPLHVFIRRIFLCFIIACCMFGTGLGIGVAGYMYFSPVRFIDAFTNSALILSDMGPAIALPTDGGKIFTAIYAMFSGLFFVIIVGVMIAPVGHRLLHHFHSQSDD